MPLAIAACAGLGVAVGVLAPPPRLLALAALGLAAVPWVVAPLRRVGLHGAWLALAALSILAGEVGAISLGGQSGHLLWADLVLAAGLGFAALRGGLRFSWPRAAHLDALWWMLAWAGASLLVARDPLTAISELKEWCVAGVAAVAALQWACSPARARTLLGVLALTGALIAAHMLLVVATSPVGPVFAILMKLVDLPWGRSNYLAGIIILALPVTLGLLVAARGVRARAAWSALLLVQSAGLVVSASKGAILALVAGLAIAWGADRRAPRLARAGVVILVVGGALVFAAGPLQEVMRYRLQASALDYSAGERMDLYRLAWQQALSHPILGIGLGNFEVISNRLHGVDTVPHQFGLGFLCETGVPGLILALGFMAALLGLAWRARSRARTPAARSLALGAWAAMIGFAAHNQIESTIYGEQYKILLLMLAAATWGLCREPEETSEPVVRNAIPSRDLPQSGPLISTR
jgi:hypothetical protein